MTPTTDSDPSQTGVEESPITAGDPASREDEQAQHGCGEPDALYVGDNSDSSVKRFNARTGAFIDDFVEPGSGGLDGPRGLVFDPVLDGDLLVASQNPVPATIPGDVLRYNHSSGAFRGALVSHKSEHAPWAPQGIIVRERDLFVADQGGDPTLGPPESEHPGQLLRYDARTGQFKSSLPPPPPELMVEFRPRGVVIGPDGDLYVSSIHPPPVNPLGGAILRYDPRTGAFLNVVVNGDNNACGCDLNRPEGLVFGPHGKLYVTSFRASAEDNDKILVFEIHNGVGTLVRSAVINLDRPGQPRAFAQAILFGPEGKLFAPITGNGPDTGVIRRYDVRTKTFTRFDRRGPERNVLGQPWFLTFGHTNPATLAYKAPPCM